MSIRTERLAGVIQQDLGRLFQQKYQPAGSFITVTNVEVTSDLMNVKVYISVYAPGQDEHAIYERLVEQKGEIRHELAGKIRHQVRRIPELDFQKDESAQHAEKMDRLFNKIQEEREQRSSESE